MESDERLEGSILCLVCWVVMAELLVDRMIFPAHKEIMGVGSIRHCSEYSTSHGKFVYHCNGITLMIGKYVLRL